MIKIKHLVFSHSLVCVADRSTKSLASKKRARDRSIEIPNLRKWPEIDVGDITQVTREILKRTSEGDSLDLFSRPVIEAHPAIADEYLEIVDNPMDIRTIEEERVNVYGSIHMLQDDLVLMFQNCCTFNGEDSELGKVAISQWEGINQIFFEVCKDLDILLPRHWKP